MHQSRNDEGRLSVTTRCFIVCLEFFWTVYAGGTLHSYYLFKRAKRKCNTYEQKTSKELGCHYFYIENLLFHVLNQCLLFISNPPNKSLRGFQRNHWNLGNSSLSLCSVQTCLFRLPILKLGVMKVRDLKCLSHSKSYQRRSIEFSVLL